MTGALEALVEAVSPTAVVLRKSQLDPGLFLAEVTVDGLVTDGAGESVDAAVDHLLRVLVYQGAQP